jgi:hypothetical protein
MKITIQLMLLMATVLLAVSCQKEIEDTFGNNGTGSGGGTGGGSSNTGAYLDSMVVKRGLETTITKTTYDANKRLIRYQDKGVSNGISFDNGVIAFRQPSGAIDSFTQYFLGPITGIDSMRWKTNYTAGKLVSITSSTELGGLLLSRDSTVFAYNANGYIAKRSQFLDAGGLGFELNATTEYSYVGANISQIKMYNVDFVNPSVLNLLLTVTRTYDNRTAAYIASTDEFAVGLYPSFGQNNAISEKVEYAIGGVPATTVNVSYVYGANGRPKTATAVSAGVVSGVYNAVYSYKN